MVRAGMFSRAVFGSLLSLAAMRSAAAAGAPAPVPRADLDVRVVILSASGRAERPAFDPRTPPDVRRQVEGQNLAYGRYDLLGVQRKPARFDADIAFDLPNREQLAIKPSVYETSPNLVRLGCRFIDEQKRASVMTVRVPYDRPFVINRARGGDSALLMGISAHKPALLPEKP